MKLFSLERLQWLWRIGTGLGINSTLRRVATTLAWCCLLKWYTASPHSVPGPRNDGLKFMWYGNTSAFPAFFCCPVRALFWMAHYPEQCRAWMEWYHISSDAYRSLLVLSLISWSKQKIVHISRMICIWIHFILLHTFSFLCISKMAASPGRNIIIIYARCERTYEFIPHP